MDIIKRMIKGDAMPDQDDPRYQKKAERAQKAGMHFAELIRLDKLAYRIQEYANNNRRIFLSVFFSLIGIMLFFNIASTVSVLMSHNEKKSAIEAQHKMMKIHHDRRSQQSDSESETQLLPENNRLEKN